MEEKQIIESIRKRPGLYLGSNDAKGLSQLICGLITDCIELTENDKLNVEFEIGINSNSFKIQSSNSLVKFTNQLSVEKRDIYFHHLYALKYLASTFEQYQTTNEFKIEFKLDDKYFKESKFDYYDLLAQLKHISILNRNCKITLRDTRIGKVNQNYFHYSEGINRYYKEVEREVIGTPKLKIEFDDLIEDDKLQFTLAYRNDWFPEPTILSYANSRPTINRDSIIEGIREGFYLAITSWMESIKTKSYEPTKEKMDNGLIVISQLKSLRYKSFENYKDVSDEKLEKRIIDISKELTSEFIKSNQDIIESFCERFNPKLITNEIFRKKATDNK